MKIKSIVCAAGVLAGPANACPLCHSRTGEQVRAALFGQEFWFNVSATVLPFAIFAIITGVIYFGGSKGKPRVPISPRTHSEDRQAP